MALGCSLCGAHREVPSELNQRRWLDVDAPLGGYPALGPATTEGLDTALAGGTSARPVPGPPLSVLVLDGGGTYTAFHSGYLVGWTATGTRPTFDVVTGVSSGALLAPFAFLGPKYDAAHARLVLGTELRDPFGIRPVRNLIRYHALGSGQPLKQLIDREITNHGQRPWY
jgi:predicted acylesterase/phospholipase RssA